MHTTYDVEMFAKFFTRIEVDEKIFVTLEIRIFQTRPTVMMRQSQSQR